MKTVDAILDQLTPVQLEYLKILINEDHNEKNSEDSSHYDNLALEIKVCPKCGSVEFIKYGKTKYGRQKYQCKGCHTIFGATTGTMFSHAKVSFSEWLKFIEAELNGLTLNEESVCIKKSKTTCFNMRHKLYESVGSFQDKQMMSGNIQIDPLYTKINLKGTKKEKMPRLSKPRGKHKTNSHGKNLAGLSHHKVCIFSSIDENDHILMKIAGLGVESIKLLEPFSRYFEEGSTVISDSKSCISKFAEKCGMNCETIPVIANQKRYKTNNGNSLAEINQLHQEFGEMIRMKHGVSIRHLQGYIDWLVYSKKLRYRIEACKRSVVSYAEVMKKHITLTERSICSKEIPIDLFAAYGEYQFGIFKPLPTI